jgi:hypothetical protein
LSNANPIFNQMKIRSSILFFVLLVAQESYSQTYKPDLQEKNQLSVTSRNFKNITENGKRGIRIEEGEGSNIMIFSNIIFSNGTVEFDVKGRSLMGQSFLGLAFHIQNDSTYDAIYFRPFNFSNPDTIRRWRAVQYISLPKYDWDKLREEFPGKYENKVNPVPGGDDWFHCKIICKDKLISVFVNGSSTPSLVVNKLTNTSNGKIGLWVDNGSDGSFANVEIRSE